MSATLELPELKKIADEHPTLPRLRAEAAELMGRDWCERYEQARRAAIEEEKADPLRFGFEPAVWKLADYHRAELRRLTPKGVIHEVNLGGNRASKTERAAKRIMQFLITHPNSHVWCCDSTQAQSRANQMRLLWKYFPPEWKNEETGSLKRTAITKVKYSKATGFTEDTFVLPNGAQCSFKFYGMSVEDLEGPELDIIWADELVPLDWIETLVYRLVTRNGLMHVTFTPKTGYTPTVGKYLDGAKTVVEVDAELLPIYAPAENESGKLATASPSIGGQESRKGFGNLSGGVESRHASESTQQPTDFVSDAGSLRRAEPSGSSAPPAQNLPNETHAGLKLVGYKKRPRVQFCEDQKARIIYFHTADNPYGNYEAMKQEVKGKPEHEVDMRVYGYVTKAAHTQFPKFKDTVHVMSMNRFEQYLRQYPSGTRYHLVDPCSGRNWFMVWAYFPFPRKCIIYREWPSYGRPEAYIPGAGDVEAWALPSRGGKKYDGQKGPAQESLGYSLLRYKEEILRVEKGEHIYERWMDARYGNTPKQEREMETTLIEQMEDDCGMRFNAMDSEKNIIGAEDGSIDMINSALYYDTETELGKFSSEKSMSRINEPWLQVVENCPNVIFALKNWTGRDGKEGACKDPVDCVRGLFLSELGYRDERLLQPVTPWAKQVRR